MNQGIYFGQVVIGPAGSGKVTSPFISSQHSANICKIWLKPYAEISSS